jgi:hypothetical protein
LAGCGSTSVSSDKEIPLVTSSVAAPESDVAPSGSEADTSLVTVSSAPAATEQVGTTTTTLRSAEIVTPVAPTTVAVTTTKVPNQTVPPNAETFEPDAPQSGFITYEPDS